MINREANEHKIAGSLNAIKASVDGNDLDKWAEMDETSEESDNAFRVLIDCISELVRFGDNIEDVIIRMRSEYGGKEFWDLVSYVVNKGMSGFFELQFARDMPEDIFLKKSQYLIENKIINNRKTELVSAEVGLSDNEIEAMLKLIRMILILRVSDRRDVESVNEIVSEQFGIEPKKTEYICFEVEEHRREMVDIVMFMQLNILKRRVANIEKSLSSKELKT